MPFITLMDTWVVGRVEDPEREWFPISDGAVRFRIPDSDQLAWRSGWFDDVGPYG